MAPPTDRRQPVSIMETDARVRRALAANQHRGRALEQRRAALDRAETIRRAIARLKDDVHTDPSWRLLADVLTGDEAREHAGRARLLPTLNALPGVGDYAARLILHAAGVRRLNLRTVRIDELAPRERQALA